MLDSRAHIDPAGDKLAGDAERQIALVARLDLADRLAVIVDGFGIDKDCADRPDLHGRVLLLAAGKNQHKREKKAPRPHDRCSANEGAGVDTANLIPRSSRCQHCLLSMSTW